MATAPLIRPISLDDAEPVAALIRAAFAAMPIRLDPPPSALGVTEATIRLHLATGGGALAPGTGCVLWSAKAGGLYLSRLAVLPDGRGRGVGLALLHAAEGEARRSGFPRVHAEVRLALLGNRRLFARAGFRETAQHAHPGYHHPTFTEVEKTF